MSRLRRICTISLVVTLLIGLWWIARPKGEFQIEIADHLEPKASEIIEEIDHAVALTPQFVLQATRLQYLLRKERIHYLFPGMSDGKSISFDDILAIEVKFKLKKGYATYQGDFRPNPLIELLYDIVGYFNYHIAVQSYSRTSTETGERQLRILLRLYPVDTKGRAIPTNGRISESSFRQKTAKYLLDAVEGDQNKQNCTRSICIIELSDDLKALEVTVNAFKFLLEYRHNVNCGPSDSDEQCISRIETQFVEALQSNPEDSFARLGLGLAQLRHTRVLLPKASVAAVGRLFMEGIANIGAARQNSEYIAHLMSTEEWATMVQETPGLSDFRVTPKFIDSADAYREARRAFVRADYKDVPGILEKIHDLPDPMITHVKNLALTAKLMSATSAEEAEPLLKDFADLPHSDSDGAWLSTYAFALCRWNRNDSHRINRALEMYDKAINLSPKDDIVTFLDRRAQKAWCLAFVKQLDQANVSLDRIDSDLAERGEHPEQEFQRVYYNLGVAYVWAKRLTKAAEYLGHAVTLDSIYFEGISKLDLLNSFRTWKGYEKWKSVQMSSSEDYAD